MPHNFVPNILLVSPVLHFNALLPLTIFTYQKGHCLCYGDKMLTEFLGCSCCKETCREAEEFLHKIPSEIFRATCILEDFKPCNGTTNRCSFYKQTWLGGGGGAGGVTCNTSLVRVDEARQYSLFIVVAGPRNNRHSLCCSHPHLAPNPNRYHDHPCHHHIAQHNKPLAMVTRLINICLTYTEGYYTHRTMSVSNSAM